MLKPLTPTQQKNIINNVKKALKDINALNAQGYKFLYLCSGFIAHYDINGFKTVYSDKDSLKNDLLMNRNFNQYSNFNKNDTDYEYYMSKKHVYNEILKGI